MPAFYTKKERKNALKQMHIHPDAERVNSMQASKILTWRAKQEYNVEHKYNATAVRKHVDKLDVKPAIKRDGGINTRQNTYSTKKLFEIDILPARTNQRKSTNVKVLTR